jgi:hypothetical protein
MKAMAMVAHPDDCVIFAYSFMHHHKHLDWTVCYLTYTEQDARGREFAEFWQRRGAGHGAPRMFGAKRVSRSARRAPACAANDDYKEKGRERTDLAPGTVQSTGRVRT